MAARRGGLTHFIMPAKNEKDLAEIPKRLLKDVEALVKKQFPVLKGESGAERPQEYQVIF